MASSSVMPMPPCSCTACWPMNRAARPTVTFAADTARDRDIGSDSRLSTARYTADTACSSSMYISTIRCCSTWKLPIGVPNCWRCLQ